MAYTTIDNPELYFQVKLYSGSNGTQSVTFDGDEDMEANLIWLKCRSTGYHNRLFNSVSGAGKNLISDNTEAEQTVDEGVTAFNSNGFSVKQGSSLEYNASGQTYVAWAWKEASGIFDIVAYTGNGSAQNISHSLSAVPKMIILKERVGTENWMVYHASNTSAPETDYLLLNATSATADFPVWNDTAPTSSVFSIGTDSSTSTSGDTYITYLFAEKQGFSKFGSYIGNGSADGTFVYTGFRPAMVMRKISSTTGGWLIHDVKRTPFNGLNSNTNGLRPNSTEAEFDYFDIDYLSNGFKCRTSEANHNSNGATYIYMAFAEQPFVNSNGVPCNAR